MDVRAVLEGEGAVHIGLARVKLRIDKELPLQRTVMNAGGDRRTGILAAENVQTARGIVEA